MLAKNKRTDTMYQSYLTKLAECKDFNTMQHHRALHKPTGHPTNMYRYQNKNISNEMLLFVNQGAAS